MHANWLNEEQKKVYNAKIIKALHHLAILGRHAEKLGVDCDDLQTAMTLVCDMAANERITVPHVGHTVVVEFDGEFPGHDAWLADFPEDLQLSDTVGIVTGVADYQKGIDDPMISVEFDTRTTMVRASMLVIQ
jgi:hypothetical protein